MTDNGTRPPTPRTNMMIRDLITEVLSENSHTTTAGTITALL